MTIQEEFQMLKNAMIQMVEDHQGMKSVDLVVNMINHFPNSRIKFNEWIPELIEKGELVEVEYILPSMDYRVKSFLLPKGTKVRMLLSSQCEKGGKI